MYTLEDLEDESALRLDIKLLYVACSGDNEDVSGGYSIYIYYKDMPDEMIRSIKEKSETFGLWVRNSWGYRPLQVLGV